MSDEKCLLKNLNCKEDDKEEKKEFNLEYFNKVLTLSYKLVVLVAFLILFLTSLRFRYLPISDLKDILPFFVLELAMAVGFVLLYVVYFVLIQEILGLKDAANTPPNVEAADEKLCLKMWKWLIVLKTAYGRMALALLFLIFTVLIATSGGTLFICILILCVALHQLSLFDDKQEGRSRYFVPVLVLSAFIAFILYERPLRLALRSAGFSKPATNVYVKISPYGELIFRELQLNIGQKLQNINCGDSVTPIVPSKVSPDKLASAEMSLDEKYIKVGNANILLSGIGADVVLECNSQTFIIPKSEVIFGSTSIE